MKSLETVTVTEQISSHFTHSHLYIPHPLGSSLDRARSSTVSWPL